MQTQSKHTRSMSFWIWAGFFMVLGIGILLVLFATIRGTIQIAEHKIAETEKLPPTVTAVIQVTLAGGDSFYIDPAAVGRIRAQTHDWVVKHRGAGIPAPILENIDRQADAILDAANQQVPAFADWYYSLSGEYARLFHALARDLPGYVEGKLEELIFIPAGTYDVINALGSDLDSGLQEQLQFTILYLQQFLTQLVREASIEANTSTVEVNAEWELGQQLSEQVTSYVLPGTNDILRQGVAASAGVGIFAAAVKKVSASSATKLSAKLATKKAAGLFAVTASKFGIKALSSAGAGATTGATICASSVVGAPASPACALALGAGAGVGTWLLVDKAIIEAEDLLLREEFENELRQALADWRDDLSEELRSIYEHASVAAMNKLLTAIDDQLLPTNIEQNRGFVPAEAAANPAMQ